MDAQNLHADADRIAEIAAEELTKLPEPFRSCVDNVAFFVNDFADPEILDDMDIESPYDLLGLYSGVSMDVASVSDVAHDLDRVFLYRRPLLAYIEDTGEDLAHAVRHVLIHEIGHHFGFSDEDMEAIESAG